MALDILRSNSSTKECLIELGRLLDLTWQEKRSLSPEISTPQIDEMYEKAMTANALGGKLCGAGGNGFLLMLVEPQHKNKVINALADYKYLDLKFHYFGAQAIYSKNI